MKLIPLNKGAFAMVDDSDFEELSKFKWYLNGPGYAFRYSPRVNGKQRTQGMHRQIMGLEHGDTRKVDHIDHNPLNNQRSNLRVCTQGQNMCNRGPAKSNRSGLKGAGWREDMGRWQAQIQMDGKNKHLGMFDTAEAADEIHGEFANYG